MNHIERNVKRWRKLHARELDNSRQMRQKARRMWSSLTDHRKPDSPTVGEAYDIKTGNAEVMKDDAQKIWDTFSLFNGDFGYQPGWMQNIAAAEAEGLEWNKKAGCLSLAQEDEYRDYDLS